MSAESDVQALGHLDETDQMPHPDMALNVVRDRAASHARRKQPGWAAQRLRRATVLAATRQLIANPPSFKVTMRRIASTAGVSIPTVHNLVGDRDEVIVRAVNDHTSSLARYACRTAKVGEFLFAHAETYWRTALVAPDFLRGIALADNIDRDLHSRWAVHGRIVVEQCLRHNSCNELFRDGVDLKRMALQTSMFIPVPIFEWALGNFDIDILRDELISVVETILLGAVKPASSSLIETWASNRREEGGLRGRQIITSIALAALRGL